VVTSTFAAPQRHASDPEDSEDHRCDPQGVKGEAASSKQKNQQKQKYD
jgi:hypothetical protein